MKLLLSLWLAAHALAADAPKPTPAPAAAAVPAQPAPTLGQPASGMADLEKKAQAEAASRVGNLLSDGNPKIQELKQKVLLLANDDEFLAATQELVNHPKRQDFLLYELGFFLFIMLVKIYQQAKAANWFWRLAIGFVSNLFFIVVGFYLLPLIVFGRPFGVFTGALWRTFF